MVHSKYKTECTEGKKQRIGKSESSPQLAVGSLR